MQFALQQQTIGPWTLRWIYEAVETMPEWALQQCQALITAWENNFPAEKTWVQNQHGRHSLLLKFDVANLDDAQNTMKIYGIDDTPDGIGIACTVNPAFHINLVEVCKTWPHVRLLNLDEKPGDDFLWLGKSLTPNEACNYRGLFFIRAPHHISLTEFSVKSVTACDHRNTRNWGEALGMWNKVSDPEKLPWKESFALKPNQGMGCHDVYLWKKGAFSGSSGKGKINEALQRHGTMWCQEFIEPMRCETLCNGSEWRMIYRIFFAYNMASACYEHLGGFWLAREKNWRLHGAPDAIMGPVL